MKNNKGITLIALIITIIVMLILVAVTVNVALDGGLFTKAKNASSKTDIHAIYETIVSCTVFTNDGYIDVQATKANAVTTLENDNKTVDVLTDETEDVVLGVNGKYYYEITPTAIIILDGEPQSPLATGIDYGSKTAETVVAGDYITIATGQTNEQKFMVLTNDTETKTISAVSFDPINPGSGPNSSVIQNPAAYACDFSDNAYWYDSSVLDAPSSVDIELNNPNNHIYPILQEYKATLEELGATNLNVRLPLYSEVSELSNSKRRLDSSSYWLGTSTIEKIYCINSGGDIFSQLCTGNRCICPAIEYLY